MQFIMGDLSLCFPRWKTVESVKIAVVSRLLCNQEPQAYHWELGKRSFVHASPLVSTHQARRVRLNLGQGWGRGGVEKDGCGRVEPGLVPSEYQESREGLGEKRPSLGDLGVAVYDEGFPALQSLMKRQPLLVQTVLFDSEYKCIPYSG